jgi:hypothetical protein
LNRETLETNLRKGSPRRDLGFGKVYSNRSYPNRLVVRVHGLPMFTGWIAYDRCVILELDGPSNRVLTSNRDGLVAQYRQELDSFMAELAVDKRSALRASRQPTYQHFQGERLRHQVQKAVNIASLVQATAAFAGNASGEDGDGMADAGLKSPRAHARTSATPESSPAALSAEFLVKNETDLQVPPCYLPDSAVFGAYSRKLIRIWGRLLLELHRLFEHEAEFALGFLFEEPDDGEGEGIIGQYEQTEEFGKVYYIAPARVVKQASGSRSWRKRLKLSQRNWLLAIAAHEFVHGLGFSQHTEEYAARLTEVMRTVLDNRARFNWCFGQ